jgi:hypothetical protein
VGRRWLPGLNMAFDAQSKGYPPSYLHAFTLRRNPSVRVPFLTWPSSLPRLPSSLSPQAMEVTRACVWGNREGCRLSGDGGDSRTHGMRAVKGAAGGSHARTRFTAHMHFDTCISAVGAGRTARTAQSSPRRTGGRAGRGKRKPRAGRAPGDDEPWGMDGVGLCGWFGKPRMVGLASARKHCGMFLSMPQDSS